MYLYVSGNITQLLWPCPCSSDYGAWFAQGLEALRRKAKVELAVHHQVQLAIYKHWTLFFLETHSKA